MGTSASTAEEFRRQRQVLQGCNRSGEALQQTIEEVWPT